jgi:hypothetical protein
MGMAILKQTQWGAGKCFEASPPRCGWVWVPCTCRCGYGGEEAIGVGGSAEGGMMEGENDGAFTPPIAPFDVCPQPE